MKEKSRLWFMAVLVTFLDMLSKLLVKHFLLLGERNFVISHFFSLTYVKNTGVAWSLFQGNTLFIIIFTVVILIGLVYYLFHHRCSFLEQIGYGMILGGAMGNLFDRIVYRYVIDFLDFYILGYDYPVFNLADMAIVVGVILLIIQTFRGDKDETYC